MQLAWWDVCNPFIIQGNLGCQKPDLWLSTEPVQPARARHWAQQCLILQRVSLLNCTVPGAGRSQAMKAGSSMTLMQG